ncbi:hypothetical protein JCM11641_008316 [Rhodosporidiobolus odoratus]
MAPKGKGKAKGNLDAGGDKGDETKLKPAQQLKLRHILCEKQSKSLEALEQLKKGIPFHQVSSTFSEDKSRTGGALGWMTRNGMIGAFQEQAFDIPPSTVSAPIYREIKSKFGYHIVMVEDRK